MPSDPGFDVTRAHRYFATDNFNRCWELIELAERTPAQDEEMLLLAQSSLWHWMQRADLAPDNLAIGHWQLARVNAISGRREEALRHAERSLEIARDINAASATELATDLPAVASDVVPAGVDPERTGEPPAGAELGDRPAYLLAYAHEAMARANNLAGDQAASSFHRAEAQRLAREIDDEQTRASLLSDLETA